MHTSTAIKKTDQYHDHPTLDKKEQGYINILLSEQLNIADAEENLILLFQHQANKFKQPSDTCNLISTIITTSQNRNKIYNAVEKMIKNGDGVTQYISSNLEKSFLSVLKQG